MSRRPIVFFVAALWVVPAAAVSTASGASADAQSQIAAAVATYMKTTKTPGVAVGYVTKSGGTLARKTYFSGTAGYAGTHIPIAPDTVFQIGSMTKVFTATIFALGAKASGVPQTTGILPYLRKYPGVKGSPAMAAVTFHDLATQSGGFPDEGVPGAPSVQLFSDPPGAPSSALVKFWNSFDPPAKMKPGTCWSYSSSGFVTLGFAATQLFSGSERGNYDTILTKEVTKPLGMTCTSGTVPSGCPLAKGTIVNAKSTKNATNIAPDIKSSADDMTKFLSAELGGDAPPALAQAMSATLTPVVNIPKCAKSSDMASGLAWQVGAVTPGGSADADGLYQKDGALGASGMSSAMSLIPSKGVGVAVLTNAVGGKNASDGGDSGPAGPQGLSNAIARILAGDAPAATVPAKKHAKGHHKKTSS